MDGYNFVAGPHRAIGLRPFRARTDDIEVQLVFGQRLAEIAYRLRYIAYLSYDYIAARPDCLFSDSYDAQPNCRTALIFRRGIEAATVRVSIFDPDNASINRHKLQAMEIFHDEIKATMATLRPNGRNLRIMEIAKLARSPAFKKDLELIFAAYRTAGYLILHHDVDIVFNAVRAHHMPIYRRFGFQQLTEPKLYPGLAFKTALMACFRPNFADARDNLPFLRGISTEDDCYAGLIAGERVKLFDTGPEGTARRAAPRRARCERPDYHRPVAEALPRRAAIG